MNSLQMEDGVDECRESMLDKLWGCITSLEYDAVRHAALEAGSPSHWRNKHHPVATLLVKQGLTTWPQLHASFQKLAEREVADGAEVAEILVAFSGSVQSKDVDAAISGLKRKADDSLDGAQAHKRQGLGKPSDGLGYPGKTLADFPRIVSWWHPTNTKLPRDYLHKTNKRVWLQCPGCPTCGEVHQWGVKGHTLTRRGDIVCPSCSSSGGSFCSCRAISANKRLAAEWHKDNPPPSTVYRGSKKSHKWRCADAACGHVWEARPADRSRADGSNCPACSHRRYRRKKPSLAVGRLELLAEWDEEKNTLLPTEVTCGSNRKVWWLCQKCSHSWQEPLGNRALSGRGCRKCNVGCTTGNMGRTYRPS